MYSIKHKISRFDDTRNVERYT